MSRRVFPAACLLAFLACVPVIAAEKADDPLAEARAGVKAARPKIEKIARRIVDRVTIKETDRLKGGAVAMHAVATEKASGDRYINVGGCLVETTQYPGMSRWDGFGVRGRNSRYAFSLTKKRGEDTYGVECRPLADAWVVSDSFKTHFALSHLHDCGRPLSELIDDEKATVTAKRQGPFVRIDIDRRYEDENSRRVGHVVLDPSAWWCVRECAFVSTGETSSSDITGTIEYRPGPDGFPLLVRRTFRDVFHFEGEQRCDLDHVEDHEVTLIDELPESEFLVSAHGVAEPTAVDLAMSSPTYAAAGVGGLALVSLVGFVLRRRAAAKRKAVPAADAPPAP